jgi:hypothetical protein
VTEAPALYGARFTPGDANSLAFILAGFRSADLGRFKVLRANTRRLNGPSGRPVGPSS